MTRNLKALGLALVAVFALSAVVASGASASPALFTAEVSAEETAKIHGGQIGTDKFVIGTGANPAELTCATASLVGKALTQGKQSTEVTLEPTYATCHAIVTVLTVKVTRTATVTMNGCAYKFNATKNTASTPFSADLTIECPEVGGVTKTIEIHVYGNAAEPHNGTVICTYDIGHQTISNQIQLTNDASGTPDDIVAHVNATVALTNTIPNATCTTATSSVYTGTDTLTATTEAGVNTHATVS